MKTHLLSNLHSVKSDRYRWTTHKKKIKDPHKKKRDVFIPGLYMQKTKRDTCLIFVIFFSSFPHKVEVLEKGLSGVRVWVWGWEVSAQG
jgi:hypothetical protein